MLWPFKNCFSVIGLGLKFQNPPTRWRTPMQVLFKSRHPEATELRDLTERRVRFVLRRLRLRFVSFER